MPTPKEKRTKEQMMRLLDRAIEQEEALLEKVKILEHELADCRKKVENPRHELEEQALPTSKVSFRLDYYQTEENGVFKGIVEHLPTRESWSFEGDTFNEIRDFVTQFVGTTALLPVLPTNAGIPKAAPDILSKDTLAGATNLTTQLGNRPFLILTEGREQHQRAVRKGQPFHIQILVEALEEFRGKPCNLRLSAESLENKPQQSLKTLQYVTPDDEVLRIPVQGLPLEQGVYRFIVLITLREAPQKVFYQESRLLIVQ